MPKDHVNTSYLREIKAVLTLAAAKILESRFLHEISADGSGSAGKSDLFS